MEEQCTGLLLTVLSLLSSKPHCQTEFSIYWKWSIAMMYNVFVMIIDFSIWICCVTPLVESQKKSLKNQAVLINGVAWLKRFFKMENYWLIYSISSIYLFLSFFSLYPGHCMQGRTASLQSRSAFVSVKPFPMV